MKPNDLLFVYGTLRIGEHASLQDSLMAKYIGEDKINGLLYNLGYYPGLKTVPGHFNLGEPFVTGDVFRLLDQSIIEILDHYENYPHLYNRVETETAAGLHVWVYTYNHDVSPDQLIKSGDWLGIRLPAQAVSTALSAEMGEMG